MTAVLVSVASAIADELDSIQLSEEVEVARSYADWEMELADNDYALRLDVVPVDCQSVMVSRAKHRWECVVNLLLRKRIRKSDRSFQTGWIDTDAVDPLVDDLETLAEFFAPSQPTYTGRKLSSVATAAWMQETTITPTRRSGIVAPYSHKMLASHGQFSGMVRLVYGVHKAIS